MWTQDPALSRANLDHWREHARWFRQAQKPEKLDEQWDGSRWRELSHFWDPAVSSLLPWQCLHCGLYNAPLTREQVPYVERVNCSHCARRPARTESLLREAFGDPRNLALLIHWDGWQPFGTTGGHPCGAIEFQVIVLGYWLYPL